MVGIHVVLNLAAQGITIHLWHHDVGDDKVWHRLDNLWQCHLAVRVGEDGEVIA